MGTADDLLARETAARHAAEAEVTRLRAYADKLEHAGHTLIAELETIGEELKTIRANITAAERIALDTIATAEAQRDAALAEVRQLRKTLADLTTPGVVA